MQTEVLEKVQPWHVFWASWWAGKTFGTHNARHDSCLMQQHGQKTASPPILGFTNRRWQDTAKTGTPCVCAHTSVSENEKQMKSNTFDGACRNDAFCCASIATWYNASLIEVRPGYHYLLQILHTKHRESEGERERARRLPCLWHSKQTIFLNEILTNTTLQCFGQLC